MITLEDELKALNKELEDCKKALELMALDFQRTYCHDRCVECCDEDTFEECSKAQASLRIKKYLEMARGE